MAKPYSRLMDVGSAQWLRYGAALSFASAVNRGEPPKVSHDGGWIVYKYHGDCKQPYMMLLKHSGIAARPSYVRSWIQTTGRKARVVRERVAGAPESPATHVKILARCRQCDNCIQWRSRVWMARACREIEDAERHHYFGTLTFSPTWAVSKGLTGSFDTEDAVDIASKELTLALKRHRKENRFRYFAVLERGELRGRLHWHILCHHFASSPLPAFATPVGTRYAFKGWHAGFTDIQKLSDAGEHWKAAAYVSKYITKSRGVRIRASLGYGNEPSDITALDNDLRLGQTILDHWDEIDH